MKICFFILIVIFFTSCSSTLYIVRHAEKSTEPAKDPHLTDSGSIRAKNLASLLESKKIKSIYSTNTNRTKQTAEPLSTQLGIGTQLYKNDTVRTVLKNIFIAKKNTLVVGHSNTILPMLDTLQIPHSKKEVPDWEYDNLIIVKYRKYCFDCATPFIIKKIKLTKYGSKSVPKGTATM